MLNTWAAAIIAAPRTLASIVSSRIYSPFVEQILHTMALPATGGTKLIEYLLQPQNVPPGDEIRAVIAGYNWFTYGGSNSGTREHSRLPILRSSGAVLIDPAAKFHREHGNDPCSGRQSREPITNKEAI